MLVKQTETIEQMMLHLIDLKKENEELRSAVKNLESKVSTIKSTKQ